MYNTNSQYYKNFIFSQYFYSENPVYVKWSAEKYIYVCIGSDRKLTEDKKYTAERFSL